MARDPGCNSPFPMIIVLVANKLFCGLFEKVAMKFYDRREKKQNKAAVAAASASTMFTISLMCFIAITALVPPTAAMPVSGNSTASLAGTSNTTAVALKSTAAIPANIRVTRQIAAHTQSCTCYQEFFGWQWKLHIGELYDEGWHCVPLFEAVVKASDRPWTNSWSCNNDGNGDISVKFAVYADKLDADFLNEELSKVFPKVNGFNCPDH